MTSSDIPSQKQVERATIIPPGYLAAAAIEAQLGQSQEDRITLTPPGYSIFLLVEAHVCDDLTVPTWQWPPKE